MTPKIVQSTDLRIENMIVDVYSHELMKICPETGDINTLMAVIWIAPLPVIISSIQINGIRLPRMILRTYTDVECFQRLLGHLQGESF